MSWSPGPAPPGPAPPEYPPDFLDFPKKMWHISKPARATVDPPWPPESPDHAMAAGVPWPRHGRRSPLNHHGRRSHLTTPWPPQSPDHAMAAGVPWPRHGRRSPLTTPWPPESPDPPWPPESPDHAMAAGVPWPAMAPRVCLFRPLEAFLCPCPAPASRVPAPPPRWGILLWRRTCCPGGGGDLSHVCSRLVAFCPYLVSFLCSHIWLIIIDSYDLFCIYSSCRLLLDFPVFISPVFFPGPLSTVICLLDVSKFERIKDCFVQVYPRVLTHSSPAHRDTYSFT